MDFLDFLEEILIDINSVNEVIFRIIENGSHAMRKKELENYANLELCQRFLDKVQDELKEKVEYLDSINQQ